MPREKKKCRSQFKNARDGVKQGMRNGNNVITNIVGVATSTQASYIKVWLKGAKQKGEIDERA